MLDRLMLDRLVRPPLLALVAICLASCGDEATLPVEAGTGPNPQLPAPVQTILPTVVLARAVGWAEGIKP